MKQLKLLLCVAFLSTICGCSSLAVDVVDLNVVLNLFQASLTELDGNKGVVAEAGGDEEAGAAAEVGAVAVAGGEVHQQEVVGIEVVKVEDDAKKDEFLTLYRTKLNAAKLVSKPIGVVFHESGSIKGFADLNKNNVQDAGEKPLFEITIDEARGRVVASDSGGHHRDHRYRPGSFFTGYMLGSMLGRNRSYYSGTRSSMKPNFSKTSMSPKTYHKSAVAKATASAKSARARTGSRGFSFGK